jgi:hypothetical protein
LFNWDSTGDLLDQEPTDEWSEESKEFHRQNKARMIEGLTHQYGERGLDEKIADLRAIGGQAFTIRAFHTRFYGQARDDFVIGAYYPALTAACSLGERILNDLTFGLLDRYQDRPEYAFFAKKESSHDWPKMTRTLESWGVLVAGVGDEFRALSKLRNRAIHYDPAMAELDRDLAIIALKHLHGIISLQFGGFGLQPWFISEARGVAFIRKDWEEVPFVKLVYVPASLCVGPHHYVDTDPETGDWIVYDQEYEDRDITDEEYLQMYETYTEERIRAVRA